MAGITGRGTIVGAAEETTWGTAVSPPTVWRPVISADLGRKVTRVPVDDLLQGAAGAAMRRRHVDEKEDAGGSFDLYASYDNFGLWLKHALGAVATTGTNPYTHTYTLGTLPAGLTVELVRGVTVANAQGLSEIFEGCRVAELDMSVEAGGRMRAKVSLIGETAAARAAGATPSFGTAETFVQGRHAGSLTFNAISYNLVSLGVKVTNQLPFFQELGSLLTKQPIVSDFRAVEIVATLQQEATLYTALQADTTGDVAITFTSGTKSMAVTLHNAYLTEAADPISGAGRVMQSVKWMGESNNTNEGLAVVVVNAASSGIAN